MELDTINQLIDTGGIIFVALFFAIFYSFVYKKKVKIEKEEEYLKDMLFLRKLVEKYRKENIDAGERENYRHFREDVTNELGYEISRNSELYRIKERLGSLRKKSEFNKRLLDNISKN
tara:strand:- start:148 stop:501 length:354 start_codon:yes stop_codon:yes gene_type:complete